MVPLAFSALFQEITRAATNGAAPYGLIPGPLPGPSRTQHANKHPSKQTNRPTTKLPYFVPSRPGGMREAIKSARPVVFSDRQEGV